MTSAPEQPLPDVIRLEGLRFHGFHGVFAEERSQGQPFEVDLALRVDLRAAGATDDLAQTVDYGAVAQLVREVVEGPPQQLIETVAERIAAAVLAHTAVQGVWVRVSKPQAPLPVTFRTVAVEISRERAP
jgi:dihydroneopterin aldolase